MRFNRHLIGSLAVAAILAPSLLHADDSSAKWYDQVSLNGYASANYLLDLNQPAAHPNNNVNHSPTNIDNVGNDNTLNMLDYNGQLTLNYKNDASKTGAVVDLLYGNIGDNAWGAVLSLGQAYFSQGFGPLTLDLGKFNSPVGYEVLNLSDNANFTRSFTRQMEPYFSVGAKVDYAGPAGIGANVWMDNGNNADYYINNSSGSADDSQYKGYGAGLTYGGLKNLNLGAFYYTHKLKNYNNDIADTADLINVTLTYAPIDSLSFGAEYLYNTIIDGNPTPGATLRSPKTNAVALYTTYNTPIKDLSISGRAEQINAPDFGIGTTGLNSKTGGLDLVTDSYTCTIKYQNGPVSNLLEYRADATNGYDFQVGGSNDHPQNVNNNSQVQQTITYAAIYGF